jgi:hypothetical protein
MGGHPTCCWSNRAPATCLVPRKARQPARPCPLSSISHSNPAVVAVYDISTDLILPRYGCQTQPTTQGAPSQKRTGRNPATPGRNEMATRTAPATVRNRHNPSNSNVKTIRSIGRNRNRTRTSPLVPPLVAPSKVSPQPTDCHEETLSPGGEPACRLERYPNFEAMPLTTLGGHRGGFGVARNPTRAGCLASVHGPRSVGGDRHGLISARDGDDRRQALSKCDQEQRHTHEAPQADKENLVRQGGVDR